MAQGRLKICIVALLLLLAVPLVAFAQKSPKTKPSKKPKGEALVVSRTDDALTGDQDALTRATETYKSSLRDLLALREQKVAEATEQLLKLKELYRDGLISRREFEENEKKLVELKAEVAEVQQKIKAADQTLAEALLESEVAAAPLATLAPFPAVSTTRRVAYIRYAGSGNWSLTESAKIESFFAGRFGRHLPVSAYGQSELHNRWGYDHRDAMDVAVHPDSPEGQALMAYLSSQRIPFLAFRQAITGSATGPHIHIGKPSSKAWAQR